MNKEFRERMENLYRDGELKVFEYNQLICLNEIAGALTDINKSLLTNNDQLQGIKSKLDIIASSK